ncbi:PQQ-binding-like beta-propeller repeat protein [Cohnella suwonensis]|uniref:PQQ-binding-like beta-propeller repeat protein n=1 Tax=Cohnella suwonensis TaxID=696072 RepID=A0ABW0LYI3_9BACL
MNGKTIGALAAALIWLAAATSSCTGDSNSAEKGKPAPVPKATSTASGLAIESAKPTAISVETTLTSANGKLSLEAVEAFFSAGALSQEAAKIAFGTAYESEAASLYSGSDWTQAEAWTYADPMLPTSLKFFWSAEDEHHLYSVFYYRDSAGVERSFVPPMGALEVYDSKDHSFQDRFGLRIGAKFNVPASSPGFDMIGQTMPVFSYVAVRGRPITLKALTDTFAEVDDDGVTSWMPMWYLTEEWTQAKPIGPLELTVRNAVAGMWFPGANAEAGTFAAGEMAIALYEYGDWYGVAKQTYLKDDSPMSLAWIRKENADPGERSVPLYDKGAESSFRRIASVAITELREGQSQARAEALFGKPRFVESSGNVEEPGKLKTLEVWRYENVSSVLTIAWTDERRVAEYRLRGKSAGEDFGVDYRHPDDQPTRAQTRWETQSDRPLAPSALQRFEWRVRTELPFNFLVGKAGDTLIVAGEDGGFSGMHETSHLYGIDRRSGKRLWSHDFGHDIHLYAVSEKERTIVFYEPGGGSGTGTDRLRAIRTDTGKQIWMKEQAFGGPLWDMGFTVSGNVAAFSYTVQNSGEKDESKTTYVDARDIRSGKKLWTKVFEGTGALLSQNGDMPAFVLQTGSLETLDAKLTAINAGSGSTKWIIRDRSAIREWDEALTFDGRFPGRVPSGYWMKSGDAFFLADASTGKTKLTFPIPFDRGARVDIVDDRRLFLQRSNDGLPLYDSKDVTSALIEARTGKELWTVKGKADRGTVDGARIVFRLDGKLVSVNLSDGKPIWNAGFTAYGNIVPYAGRLLVAGWPDVYLVNGKDGRVEHRLADQNVGYYDGMPSRQVFGNLTALDGELYVGSSNGFFGKIGPNGLR